MVLEPTEPTSDNMDHPTIFDLQGRETPWKINGWNLQTTNHPKGKWSEPNLYDL